MGVELINEVFEYHGSRCDFDPHKMPWMFSGNMSFQGAAGFVAASARPTAPNVIWISNKIRAWTVFTF